MHRLKKNIIMKWPFPQDDLWIYLFIGAIWDNFEPILPGDESSAIFFKTFERVHKGHCIIYSKLKWSKLAFS